jgi:predicted RNA-binding protein with TRAM domain
MKKYVYYGVLAALVFGFVSCNADMGAVDESAGNSGDNLVGHATEGVYATFIAKPGKFPKGTGVINELNVALAYTPVPSAWYYANGDEITGENAEAKETAFLNALYEADKKADDEANDNYWLFTGYNYENDPLKLDKGRKSNYEESPLEVSGDRKNSGPYPTFILSGSKQQYKYFIQQKLLNGERVNLFNDPVLASKIFTVWKVGSTNSLISISQGEKDAFDTDEWSIILPAKLEVQDKPYITLLAKWIDNPEADAAKSGLQSSIDEVDGIINDPQYDDEYVIGAPIDKDADNTLVKLQGLLTRAAELLEGEETEIEIRNIEDGGKGDAGVIKAMVILYSTEEMKSVKDEIDEELRNSAVIEALKKGLYPQQITIPYPAGDYDYASVTIADDGDYEIELWGAPGGPVWSRNNRTAFGGRGGLVKAKLALKAGDVLKVFVGGAGVGSATYTNLSDENAGFTKSSSGRYSTGKAGGHPNGGNGGNAKGSGDNTFAGGSGGGGSTDVRLFPFGSDVGPRQALGDWGGDTGVYITTLDKRILVAGGGGGAAQGHEIGTTDNWPGIRGGDAGEYGEITDNRKLVTNDSTPGQTSSSVKYMNDSDGNENGRGDTGYHTGGNWEGRGGGGGGYRGGIAATTGGQVASGGGGTNYIAPASIFTDGRTIENLLPEITPPLISGASPNEIYGANYLSPIYGNGKATIRWTPPVEESTEESTGSEEQ